MPEINGHDSSSERYYLENTTAWTNYANLNGAVQIYQDLESTGVRIDPYKMARGNGSSNKPKEN